MLAFKKISIGEIKALEEIGFTGEQKPNERR
jgi:hypothetical protein